MNKKEGLSALIDGKKIKADSLIPEAEYFYLADDDTFRSNDGREVGVVLGSRAEWELYKDPKDIVEVDRDYLHSLLYECNQLQRCISYECGLSAGVKKGYMNIILTKIKEIIRG